MKFRCAHCGKTAAKPAGTVNRALAAGLRLFCDRKCAGLGRRKHKTHAQKIAEKRAYDQEYRRKNIVSIKAKKRAHFHATYDPVKAAEYRKKRMPRHVEYCRQPKYKAWKSEYDKHLRARKNYGPFAEVAMLVIDLNREIKGRATNHEIKWQNETANKRQFRRREAREEKERSRPRGRDRRRDHTPAHS